MLVGAGAGAGVGAGVTSPVGSGGGKVKFIVAESVPWYNTLSVMLATIVELPDELGVYLNETVLGESVTFCDCNVCPFIVKVTVPGNWAYFESDKG